MADVIELTVAPKPKTYTVDVEQSPENLAFTVNGIKVSRDSLKLVADELEKIAQIIRNDIVTGIV